MTVLEEWRCLARQENRRARTLWTSGVADEDETVSKDATSVVPPDKRRTLATRLRQLFEAGYAPDEVAVKELIPEAAIWQELAGHLRAKHGMKKFALPPVFFRMRVERILALQAAGLKRKDIAAKLGVRDRVVGTDLKRAKAGEFDLDAAGKKSGRAAHTHRCLVSVQSVGESGCREMSPSESEHGVK